MKAHCGTYALILKSTQKKKIRIGKIGTLQVNRGYYVYIGSAFGPGGLSARISHHQRCANRPHWHIDYLNSHLKMVEIWYTYDPVQREHDWAGVFALKPGSHTPLPGFGSSDCGCDSHLFFFSSRPSIHSFHSRIKNRLSDKAKIFSETVWW